MNKRKQRIKLAFALALFIMMCSSIINALEEEYVGNFQLPQTSSYQEVEHITTEVEKEPEVIIEPNNNPRVEKEVKQVIETTHYSDNYESEYLTSVKGVNYNMSGMKETYYNLDMSGVIRIMRSIGNNDEYHIREDGVKMLGDYIMVAAYLPDHPRGSIVRTSLGLGIVCDTGDFADYNHEQLDIAVSW